MNTKSPARPGVLSGIRVLDFTWKTVGPWAPRLLTHYGAEVIHVERAGGYDDHRYNATPSIVSDEPKAAQLPGTKKVYADPQFNTLRDETAEQSPGEKKLYAAPYFNTLHHGKLAISLNTRNPEGLKIVERLIGICDALVENFSAEVLPNWGLTWERIHQLNPRLVYMSTSGFGHSGDWKGYRSFGPTAAAQSGISLASGLPGQAARGLGLLVSRRDGRLDGRPRADAGAAAGEEDRQGVLHRLRGDRRRDVDDGHLHARLSGERPAHAPPGFPARQPFAVPGGRAAQHVPLRRQGSRRAGLVGVHRVRDAGAVRVAVRGHGSAGARARSEVRDQRSTRDPSG